MIGRHWHQLDQYHMQIICISLQTDNHSSTSPLSFYRPDALPATQPTVSKHCRQMERMKLFSILWSRFCGIVAIQGVMSAACRVLCLCGAFMCVGRYI